MEIPSPELSVIVPVLNEAPGLPALFAMLGRQTGVRIELVISDGGSTDGTLERSAELARSAPFPSRIVRSSRGRGRQLNAGAAAAAGESLLFLHADCRFPDPRALAEGLAAVSRRAAVRGDARIAGRFALRFDRSNSHPSFPYHFYESKARLDRPGCIHGDQGFLLRREFYARVGPFAEDLPCLEDDQLADAVRREGEWLLLPAEIHTSARRFEIEGLRERQVLNAILMNFHAIGFGDILRCIPDLYRAQDRTRRLQLLPFFHAVRAQLAILPQRERFAVWYRTGSYVRANAWQLAFACRARKTFRLGLPPGTVPADRLAAFDRWFDLLTDHPPGRLLTAVLVRIWFQLIFVLAGRLDDTASARSAKEGDAA